MPDESDIMQAVKKVCGPSLDDFSPSTPVPVAFWAALTANESGANILRGDAIANITRREPAVFTHLALVAAGFSPSYGAIALSDIVQADVQQSTRPVACHTQFALQAPSLIKPVTPANPEAQLSVAELLAWATSWGWTQLMGYHAIEWKVAVDDLVDPEKHYRFAAKLMGGFIFRFKLDPATDFDRMARCWNTGRPDGVTYDPKYVPNLQRRMKLWGEI